MGTCEDEELTTPLLEVEPPLPPAVDVGALVLPDSALLVAPALLLGVSPLLEMTSLVAGLVLDGALLLSVVMLLLL
jgi:hypothetical protein